MMDLTTSVQSPPKAITVNASIFDINIILIILVYGVIGATDALYQIKKGKECVGHNLS